MFENRQDAGRKLSERLEKYKGDNVIILAVPRGGVIVAYEAVKRFGFKWDMIIPRKIGAPQNREVAIGAVSADGSYFIDEYYAEMLGVSKEYIENEVAREVEEIARRAREYRGSDSFPDVRDRTVIIVDDGIATGFTLLAAVKSVRKQGAGKIVLAVPVAPEETVQSFERITDEVICLLIPEDFHAVGQYYKHFGQVTDNEIFSIIKHAGR